MSTRLPIPRTGTGHGAIPNSRNCGRKWTSCISWGVTPRQDYWKLEAFEPYEKQLRKAGIAKPGDLYQKETGHSDISAYLQVSPLVLKRLCRQAALVRRAEAVPCNGDAWHIYLYRVEVVAALVQAGIDSPDDIQNPWIDDNDSDGQAPATRDRSSPA